MLIAVALLVTAVVVARLVYAFWASGRFRTRIVRLDEQHAAAVDETTARS
jgi:hypothetical protein